MNPCRNFRFSWKACTVTLNIYSEGSQYILCLCYFTEIERVNYEPSDDVLVHYSPDSSLITNSKGKINGLIDSSDPKTLARTLSQPAKRDPIGHASPTNAPLCSVAPRYRTRAVLSIRETIMEGALIFPL